MKAEKMLVTGSAGFIGFHSLVNLDNLQKANGPCFGVVLVNASRKSYSVDLESDADDE